MSNLTLRHTTKVCELEDLTDNDLVRFCVSAVAEHEDVRDNAEVAALIRDLRDQGGPTFNRWGSGVEVELLGNTYMIMDWDEAQALAQDAVEDFANDQANELTARMNECGINSMYMTFNYDMFVQDNMYEWACWLGSYDDVVNEFNILYPGADGKLESWPMHCIWRTD